MNPYYRKKMYFIYTDKIYQGFKVADNSTEKNQAEQQITQTHCFGVVYRLSLEFADKLFLHVIATVPIKIYTLSEEYISRKGKKLLIL